MIGSFLTRGLVMFFGYAYPAFECFKTVEKNKPDIEQLRFWCQYWILVAVLTICERFSDTFMSWVPMYSEAKLVFYMYLWYPKTKGTTYVYDSFFRPYVSKHQNEIDHNLMELRARAGDMVVLYFQKAASYGQTRVFEILHFVASQSIRIPQTTEPQQQAPRACQPAATATNRTQHTGPPQPPQNEDRPSPTSSTSSTQHQREIDQELSSLQPPSEAAPSPTSAAPLAQNSPRRMLSSPVSTVVRKMGQPSDPEISSSQLTLKKAAAQQPRLESSEQSGTNEAGSMQIEPACDSQLEKARSQPPPEGTVMEEAIRVTRGRLRKTRSIAK